MAAHDGLRIFLSYPREEEARVGELYEWLRRSGHKPWLDTEHLVGGQAWGDEIRRALAESDIVIVCLTEGVQGRREMQAEIKDILDERRRHPSDAVWLVPVRLEDCAIPSEFTQLHTIDLFAAAGYQRLETALRLRSEQLGKQPSAAAATWIERLNAALDGYLRVYRILTEPEKLIPTGEFSLPEELRTLAMQEEDAARREGRPNDPHAILNDPDVLERSPLRLDYVSLWYSELVALASTGERPATITANTVVTDDTRQQLILHWRSPQSRLYPGTRSICGGAFAPQMGTIWDRSLRATARREFEEESGKECFIDQDTPRLLTREVATGAVQVNYLGARLIEVPGLGDSWEGTLDRLAYADLEDALVRTQRWAPLGWGSVLAWLAIGAPGTDALFAGRRPQAVFDDVLDHVERSGYSPPPTAP